ncbi:hypothetical protein N7468_008845 [Penicillium chermesinum]|uniref:Ankyrin repeat protein n=1 Tax=Penicillium chermesinum TaxID=63820 RepID=A0A9W9NGW0_9EURO|nr:uncharacterized protein N7468_008845 [Penicillium chermesinum]KAJ5219641.1 hypothetical protein N7468_008845 [Penicillium chermesinum]
MDLHQAARRGSVLDIQSAIEEGCDVNTRDEAGKTPLWFAVQEGHLEACKFLIARGASVEEQIHNVLELAVQEGYAEIVELLWPHCEGERQYLCLETAISLGFHGIADFFIETRAFEYQHSQSSHLEMIQRYGFPARDIAAFQQWERFIFVRRFEKLPLNRIFFDYALLLATKADRNAGLRLVTLLLQGDTPLANPNCIIKIDAEIETPLTNAAEKNNLEILDILVQRPDIQLTSRGKYGWPAFLHLLATPDFIDSEKGRIMARMLSNEPFPHFFPIDDRAARLEIVFRNALRLEDNVMLKRLIDLIHGAAGTSILPLLIKANDAHGLRWLLNSDVQFFYPLNEILPMEIAEETLAGLSQASMDQSLMKEWADKGFANATLWSALRFDTWKSPAFESLLSCSYVDLDKPFPSTRGLGAGEANIASPPLIGNSTGNSTGQKRKFQSGSAADSPGLHVPLGPPDSAVLTDYQIQLILLEQANKRRLAREGKGEPSILKSPLVWAAANRKPQLVELLLCTSRVDVNSQDSLNQTSLMHAIAVNDQQTVEILLKSKDIDLNLRDHDGRTAIFHATEIGDLHIIRLLTETRRVDLSIRDSKGKTVIDLAKKTKNQNLVAALTP